MMLDRSGQSLVISSWIILFQRIMVMIDVILTIDSIFWLNSFPRPKIIWRCSRVIVKIYMQCDIKINEWPTHQLTEQMNDEIWIDTHHAQCQLTVLLFYMLQQLNLFTKPCFTLLSGPNITKTFQSSLVTGVILTRYDRILTCSMWLD